MLKKSVLALGAIALATSALLLAQGTGRQQQGFTDCDLDIRPNNRKEVQVYWGEGYAGSNGMTYHLWTAQDNVAKVGLPDGSGTLYDLKAGKSNDIKFRYNTSTNVVEIALLCDDPDPSKCTWITIPTIGSYNSVLPLGTPTEERARAPMNGQERLLIKCSNFGLEFSFTLTRTIEQ